MRRSDRSVLVFVVLFFLSLSAAYAATSTVMIRNGRISNARLAVPQTVPDLCASVAVGDPCTNGVLYGGTGFAGLGSYKYMITPGNCTDSATPTCNGATDTTYKKWANNSGTTAYGVNTGATSTTDGASNTTTLATSYTDTDAARYCENMIYPSGGYTDWYLPAIDELNLVLYAMKVAGKGNFEASYYWSSTDSNTNGAWGELFTIGYQHPDVIKTNNYYVRCVRRYL
jgi:hypothetical protein